MKFSPWPPKGEKSILLLNHHHSPGLKEIQHILGELIFMNYSNIHLAQNVPSISQTRLLLHGNKH